MPEVVLALGSNLGDRAANLRRAVIYLQREGVAISGRSSIWETPPFPEGQPPFCNAAVRGSTTLPPHALLELVKRCDHDLGRRETWHWGPRVIDVDILLYDDLEVTSDRLTIPHPRIAERAFVLVPLGEVWRGPLPVLGVPAETLLANVDTTGIELTQERL